MRTPSFETLISFVLYIGALIYALYHAYKYGQSIDVPEDESAFSDGWLIAGRKRDEFDIEWESFVESTQKYIYWYICHVLLSEIVRQLEPHRIYFVHAIIGVLFVCISFKPLVVGSIFVMVISYYITMLGPKYGVWTLTVIWLGILNMLKQRTFDEWLSSMTLTDKEVCDAMIALSWLMLRVTSFALDYCNARKNWTEKQTEQEADYFSTLHYLSYSFYLPVFLHGPPLIYERYGKMYDKMQLYRVQESWDRIKELLVTLLRIIAVYFLNELCMHFIYANAIIHDPDQMQYMNLWAVYGFAYAIGQYFCNKYIVSYGFTLALAKFDRIDAPQRPMCVGRIHLYSKMWKYFDQGLHDFLFKHIYAEMCSKTSWLPQKLFASFVSFAFIYLWHGYYLFLLFWVFLNLISLYIELFGRYVSQSERYNTILKPYGHENIQRLNAFFGGQLLISSSISNVMFIGGPDVGKWLTIHTYLTGGWLNYILLSISAYNLFRVSSFIFQCEKLPSKKTV